jgi:putative FmdB family regulatory protein
MPLKDVLCRDCGHIWEELLKSWEDSPDCPHCESKKTEKLISAPGGYSIKGNNSASVRPAGAGSFKKAGAK